MRGLKVPMKFGMPWTRKRANELWKLFKTWYECCFDFFWYCRRVDQTVINCLISFNLYVLVQRGFYIKSGQCAAANIGDGL